MKKLLQVMVIMAVALCANNDSAFGAGGWSLARNSGGIKVYERAVPGTDLVEYMGVTTIDEKMEVIGEVLRNVPGYRLWIADCYGAQVEKTYDRNTMIIYMVLRPPIIEERDIILKDKAVYDWDNARASISFATTEEVKIPVEKKRTRVTIMSGVFDMEYLGRNRTKFIYRLLVDPAGSIPKKVAYAVMKSYPYDTLKKLKALLPDKKYDDTARGTEEERAIESRTRNEAYLRKTLANRLSKFVKDRGALQAIINADKNRIRNIVDSGGTYDSVEKATTAFYIAYIEKVFKEKNIVEKLGNNEKFIQEMTDMVVSDCGASGIMLESIVEKYRK